MALLNPLLHCTLNPHPSPLTAKVATQDAVLPADEFVIAHDRASFLAGNKVQKLMETGGPIRIQWLVVGREVSTKVHVL